MNWDSSRFTNKIEILRETSNKFFQETEFLEKANLNTILKKNFEDNEITGSNKLMFSKIHTLNFEKCTNFL